MPNGLVFPLAFGILTLLAGCGVQSFESIISDTSSVLKSPVRAIRSSVPGVPRPLLICVTCLTLNSAFVWLLNISRCRDLSFLMSPCLAAQKICCRNPLTASMVRRHSMSRQCFGLSGSLGLATARLLSDSRFALAFSGRFTCHTSARFHVGYYPIQRVIYSPCFSTAGFRFL